MANNQDIQYEMKPEEFEEQPEPKKKSTLKWFLVIVLICLLGFAGVWHFSQFRPFNHIVPLESLQDPNLEMVQPVDFKEPLLRIWKEHAFKSHSSYQVADGALHASSRQSSSMIYDEMNLDVSKRLFLTWEWKATQFPGPKTGQNPADKLNNDFAGRVYAIFKGRSPLSADVIQYVWDDQLPEGTVSDSPFLKNVKILVVQSGKSNDWVVEKRDLLHDYQTLFGRRPRWPLSAVGVMSDSDNTKSSSEAYFRNISVQKPKQNQAPAAVVVQPS